MDRESLLWDTGLFVQTVNTFLGSTPNSPRNLSQMGEKSVTNMYTSGFT